jgi:RimJ/RimL family protein N-acetyltransferase
VAKGTRLVAELIETERLVLEPLRVDHAEEMAVILHDTSLHEFMGGEPDTVDQLRARYERQVVGESPDGTQGWLNWIVRGRDSGAAMGFVQATVMLDTRHDEVAWVIGAGYQRRGFATEAAQGMVDWLRCNGTRVVVAHIHPDHAASAGVARHLGLRPTSTVVDGEIRWTSDD